MKKVILLGLILLFITGGTIAGASSNTYRVLINGHVITQDTVTESGVTLVPFKVIFEELDYKIVYTAATKTIKADKDGISVSLTVGSTKAFVNGKETKMPVTPKFINGVTYVPLRFVADVSGEEVSFDNKRNAIQIGKQIDWAQLDQPSFRNAKWGMTLSQVKKLETSTLLEENHDSTPYLAYKTEFAGFYSMAAYFFPNSTLGEAGYFIQGSNANSYVQDYKTLTAYLTKRYGEPTFEMLQQLKEKEALDYTDEEWNQWVHNDDAGFVATWETVDSEVMLVVKPELQDISDIQISYKSRQVLRNDN